MVLVYVSSSHAPSLTNSHFLATTVYASCTRALKGHNACRGRGTVLKGLECKGQSMEQCLFLVSKKTRISRARRLISMLGIRVASASPPRSDHAALSRRKLTENESFVNLYQGLLFELVGVGVVYLQIHDSAHTAPRS